MIEIMTPATHPHHPTVGHRFRAWDGCTYFCDSYDPSCGYWMTCVANPGNILSHEIGRRRNVSERAIGRTFFRLSK